MSQEHCCGNFLQARCHPDPTNSVCALKEVYTESLTRHEIVNLTQLVNSVKMSLAHAKQAIYTANMQYIQHYVHVVFLGYHDRNTAVAKLFTGQMPSWPNQQCLRTEGSIM